MDLMPSVRRGAWTATYSGGRFFPLDARPDDVRIADIAHALSNVCRFGGHTRAFYSVAQHSVYVSWHCDPVDSLWGLLHDASEAYLGDVCRPLKRQPLMDGYREAETRLMGVICERFDLPSAMPASVHLADNRVLKAEADQLMNRGIWTWTDLPEVDAPPDLKIKPWAPAMAERVFLARFEYLIGQRAARTPEGA